MRLIDRIAQCHTPYVIQNHADQSLTRLTGAANFAEAVKHCASRYVLTDELTRLCTALAYSKGVRTVACADLIRVPAERLWIEWCDMPWSMELNRYGFKTAAGNHYAGGRRGAYIVSSAGGRRGVIRAFWTNGEEETDVLASSMEAYFDLDADEGVEPTAPDLIDKGKIVVTDKHLGGVDLLRRCFRFRFERTWASYYAASQISPAQFESIKRHALGTIAIAIPVLLAFLLLMTTRPGLPRRPVPLERLNQSRERSGKAPLLEHVEVSVPLSSDCRLGSDRATTDLLRRSPRLHHVRGHLVRRGSELHWRVPHLRGNARLGSVKSRTVTWTVTA